MTKESTTPDLVELVRKQLEAVNRRDLDAVMSFYAPDSVWESPPLGTSFTGLAAGLRVVSGASWDRRERRLPGTRGHRNVSRRNPRHLGDTPRAL